MMKNVSTALYAVLFLGMTAVPSLDGAAAATGTSSRSTGIQQPAACAVTPAYYCVPSSAGGSLSAPTPGVLAIRLSICRGDSEGASRILQAINRDNYRNSDLRFALGNLALLKGSRTEAARAFAALKESSPGEGWGDWGLGLIALAEGDPAKAAEYMRQGSARRSRTLEGETAVLKYLVRYWLRQESAPGEEAFLSLFPSFASFRDCYRDRG